jgi:uncharacterized OB-fold protein
MNDESPMTSQAPDAPWTRDPSGVVWIRYKACLSCGREVFPAQSYGCSGCGSHRDDVFVERRVEAMGEVLALVDVHPHPEHPTPYRVGEIAVAGTDLRVQALLDGHDLVAGDSVRALLTGDDKVAFVATREVRV